MNMKNGTTKIFAAGIAALLLAGCDRDGVKVYHVTNTQTQSPPTAVSAAAAEQPLPPGHPAIAGATMAAPGAADNASSPLTWKTPAGWTEVPPSELRLASFKINQGDKMTDVSVVPLGPMAGTDPANVNRWRGQVGLPQATDAEIQKSAETVEAAGQPAQLYDVAGTNPGSGDKTRIIAAIQHLPDATWFYKMIGDADLTEAQKPAFIEFLKSLKFANGVSVTAMPSTAAMPPGHPAIGDMGAAAPAGPISHEGQPDWKVPADWHEIAGGQFLIAKVLIGGQGGAQAAVNVSSSAGDGGGMMANVNRWRGQLGLAPSDSLMTTPIDLAGDGKAQSIEMSGTNPQTGKPAELVGVMVSQGDRAWFYKLMGDATVVAAQKDTFVKFVQSVKY
jgi:hypothetical protein